MKSARGVLLPPSMTRPFVASQIRSADERKTWRDGRHIDPTPTLIFADYLEENNDPRADLLRKSVTFYQDEKALGNGHPITSAGEMLHMDLAPPPHRQYLSPERLSLLPVTRYPRKNLPRRSAFNLKPSHVRFELQFSGPEFNYANPVSTISHWGYLSPDERKTPKNKRSRL